MSASDSALRARAAQPSAKATVRATKAKKPRPAEKPPADETKLDAAAKPDTKPEAKADTPDEGVAPRAWVFSAVPAWLVSLTIHLVAVLLLAWLTFPIYQKQLGTVFEAVAGAADPNLDELESRPVELQTSTTVSTSISAAELVSVADAKQLASVTGPSLDVETASPVEIGVLFAGDSGKSMSSRISGNATSGAQFFGVKATGRRFVFIVDSSNSMRGGKFDAAKEELMYSIRRLNKDQAFYILFFDYNSEPMLLPPDKEPPLLPVPATGENINRVEKWVNTVENQLRTDPYDSVKAAIDMVPDAIYLLTDGKFTDKGRTERYLKTNNIVDDPVDGKKPKVVVHTICFWQNDGEDTLKAIAKDYGGTYRFVPRGQK